MCLCAPCQAVHGMLAYEAKVPNIRTPGKVQTDNTNSKRSGDCRLSTAPHKPAMIAAARAYQRLQHLAPTLTSKTRRFVSSLSYVYLARLEAQSGSTTFVDSSRQLGNMNQFYKAYAVAIASLLTGAAVVHNIYKPDLVSHLNPQFLSAVRVEALLA